MTLALVSLGIISLSELLLWLAPFWRLRRPLARTIAAALALASALLLASHPSPWTALLAMFSAYRCFNLMRIAASRIQADYLFHASRLTTFWLTGIQLGVVALAALSSHYHIAGAFWWCTLAAAQLACAAILLGSTLRHLRTTTPPRLRKAYTEAELPSVTVAIPARNETEDLEACLRSLLSSTYPKLEILVLDDCSQNKRTPEIIRGFAHDGVRFIAGDEPPGQWLAKNYAYARLAEAANAEVLLFCGVDVRFQPESIGVLVKTMLQKRKTMVSVIPRNLPPDSRALSSWLLQPNRYAWELALPRRLLKRPPVLSTCWLITRQMLEKAGGFQAVRRKGVPESYLARAAAATDDGYSFLRSEAELGITSKKSLIEQRATAVRTRYLQLHRRPELVALVSLLELGLLIGPLLMLAVALLLGEWVLAGLAGLSFLTASVMYGEVTGLAYRQTPIKGTWSLTLAVFYDIGLLNYSMWRYEFSEVMWKGRNVCIPIMQVIPRLPEL